MWEDSKKKEREGNADTWASSKQIPKQELNNKGNILQGEPWAA